MTTNEAELTTLLQNARRPEHIGDDFFLRHPRMPVSKRAKLFMPFDALRGFDAAIDIAKDTSCYTPRRELDEGEIADLDRHLRHLSDLFLINRKYRRTTTAVVSHFVAMDTTSYDTPIGKYITTRGDVSAISPTGHYLILDGQRIAFADIALILRG